MMTQLKCEHVIATRDLELALPKLIQHAIAWLKESAKRSFKAN
jgi:hypothetical protein